MSVEDSSVIAARQAITQVLRLNQASPENLAGLFDQYLYLLTDDTDALLLKFAQQAEPPSVEQYEEPLSTCQAAAETIRCGFGQSALLLVFISRERMKSSSTLESRACNFVTPTVVFLTRT